MHCKHHWWRSVIRPSTMLFIQLLFPLPGVGWWKFLLCLWYFHRLQKSVFVYPTSLPPTWWRLVKVLPVIPGNGPTPNHAHVMFSRDHNRSTNVKPQVFFSVVTPQVRAREIKLWIIWFCSVLPWRSVFLCELSATTEGRQPRPLRHRPGRVPPLQAPWRRRCPQV